MNKNKLIWAITFMVLPLLIAVNPVYSGDATRIGTAAGEQLLVPVGARGLALGGANVGFISGVEAIYWNPAGLSSMDNTASGTFSTMSIFSDISVNYMAVAVKAGGLGAFGFSLKSFDFGDIPVTTNQDWDGSSGETFSPTFMTLGLTYSRMLTDAIQVGATGKLVNESIPRASANAFAFDIGLQYHGVGGIQGLSMGLIMKNIGTNIQYTGAGFLTQAEDVGSARTDFRDRPTADHQLPATVELGMGYQRIIAENSTLQFSGDFTNNNFGNDDYKFGLEYMYSELIALRGGYQFVNNIESDEQLYPFTLGLGLHYAFGNTNLTFNYTYRDSKYFDGNNLFELTLGF